MSFIDTAKRVAKILRTGIPKEWDGRKCITEMRDKGGRHWKQMEWMGFYFQFACETQLAKIMEIPGPKFGHVEFDGFCEIPWDFKAHAMNTSSHKVIVNGSEAVARAIKEYDAVGLILAMGEVVYNDEDKTFQAWHEKVKGGESNYTRARKKRGARPRRRKVSFDLQQISFIRLTDETLIKCGSFQEGFRNSDGSPRRPKILIDLEKLDEETVHFVEF
ncbi:MAG: hypothetical protein KAV00_08585 [Phycisphaerae bacterium]|nr:hypothetical protein [Phycisphaerae bacterium]